MTSTAPSTTTWLRPGEVAAALGVSTETLRRWRLAGRGPAWTTVSATAVRYFADAVEAWPKR